MRSCREIYEKKMFENEKVHLKVEQLNGEALNVRNRFVNNGLGIF